MHSLTITLFELGQFLRILLWIACPIIMAAILIAVYTQYRKKAKGEYKGGEYWISEEQQKEEPRPGDQRPEELGVEGETVYQGLLWLKNRYEQDRERSTAKYMQLKEEHAQLKEKYLQLETRHAYTQELLNERQAANDRLREQLEQETLRTAEVKGKLESSGHLLLKIHRELDQVLATDPAHPADLSHPSGPARPGDPTRPLEGLEAGEGTRIASWVESDSEAIA